MAFVYKYDRCGKIVDDAFAGGGNGPFVWDGILSKDQEHMDLCEECCNDLIHWLSRDKPRGADENKHCDSCVGCKFENYAEHMYPCNCCSNNFVNRWQEKGDN
jgi:hypothetical protein